VGCCPSVPSALISPDHPNCAPVQRPLGEAGKISLDNLRLSAPGVNPEFDLRAPASRMWPSDTAPVVELFINQTADSTGGAQTVVALD